MTDVLFVVTHLHGIGHLRRIGVLARACSERGLEATVVSGGRPLRDLNLGPARLIQLEPWLRSRDERFTELLGPEDRPLDDSIRIERRDRLLAILAQAAPKVLVTEHYPFGRGKLRFEFEPLVGAARALSPRPWVVSSVRDLLVRKPAEKTLWMAEAARAYDRILVHGDPDLIPFEASFAQSEALAEKLAYTGYVTEAAIPPPRMSGGETTGGDVIVSAGGGAFGRDFLQSALQARRLSNAHHLPWRLLVGDNLPEEDFRALSQAAEDGIEVQRAQPDFTAQLARCALSISQGGYNTAVDLLRAGCPAVVVPYEEGGQSEQRQRADLLHEGGWLTCAAGGDGDPLLLASAIDRELTVRRPSSGHPRPLPKLNGAEVTAEILGNLAAIVPPPDPGDQPRGHC